MADHKFFRETPGAVSVAIEVLTVEKAPADWIQSVAGGAIAWKDGQDTATGVANAGAGDVFPGPIREIVSSAGVVRYGTGPLPIPGPTAAASGSATAAATSATAAATSATAAASSATSAATSATAAATSATAAASSATSAAASALAGSGIQKDFAADGSAAATTAETYVSSVIGPCNVDPCILSRGTATASDTTYATFTVKLYRAGTAAKTWTMTTKTSGGSGGTGNWTDGAFFAKGDPFAALAGDYLTVAVAKASTGVQLPAHMVGAKIT